MKYLTYIKDNWKIVSAIIVILIFLSTVTYLQLQINEYQTINQNLLNRIADDTQIKKVITDKFNVLYERNVRVETDLLKSIKDNKNLSKYIKEQKGEIEFLMKKNTEVHLENIRLLGLLKKDSAGNEYAEFDSTTNDYSIQTEVGLRPRPYMFIKSLSFFDSSYIGIISQDSGSIKGFITHSNQFVIEKSAEFSIPIRNVQIDKPRSIVDYLILLASILATYGATKL